jgi:hypothetical protein
LIRNWTAISVQPAMMITFSGPVGICTTPVEP